MKAKCDRVNADRRGFLKLAGVGAAVGGVALVSGKNVAEANATADDTGGHYTETDHIKTYYELARF
jgi:hypothetical protein